MTVIKFSSNDCNIGTNISCSICETIVGNTYVSLLVTIDLLLLLNVNLGARQNVSLECVIYEIQARISFHIINDYHRMLLKRMLLIRNVILVPLVLINHVKSFNGCPESSLICRVLTLLANLIVGLIQLVFLIYANVIEVHEGVGKRVVQQLKISFELIQVDGEAESFHLPIDLLYKVILRGSFVLVQAIDSVVIENDLVAGV